MTLEANGSDGGGNGDAWELLLGRLYHEDRGESREDRDETMLWYYIRREYIRDKRVLGTVIQNSDLSRRGRNADLCMGFLGLFVMGCRAFPWLFSLYESYGFLQRYFLFSVALPVALTSDMCPGVILDHIADFFTDSFLDSLLAILSSSLNMDTLLLKYTLGSTFDRCSSGGSLLRHIAACF